MEGLFDGLGDFEGLFDGLGDFEGLFDGLGDFEGLLDGLLLGLGLELAEGLGLLEALLDGLGLLLGDLLALGEPDPLWPPVSRLADVAAVVPRPHGDPAGRAGEASAGAIASPVARKNPPALAAATRQDLAIPTGTMTLPRAVCLRPYLRA